jgi:hypothetical protein
MTLVWPYKFLLLVLAVNPDGSYNDHSLYDTQYKSLQECEIKKPDDHKLRSGITLVFRCVIQGGA